MHSLNVRFLQRCRPEDPIHASQETLTVSFIKINRSLSFRKIRAAYCEHHMEHINMPSGKTLKGYYVKCCLQTATL